jgi:hypothetical protein
MRKRHAEQRKRDQRQKDVLDLDMQRTVHEDGLHPHGAGYQPCRLRQRSAGGFPPTTNTSGERVVILGFLRGKCPYCDVEGHFFASA